MIGLVVVGAGGFGREVHDIVVAMTAAGTATWDEFLGYVDDLGSDQPLLARQGVAFLGDRSAVSALGSSAAFAIGIGSGDVRRTIDGSLSAAGCRPITLIHPAATVGGDNRIGEGCILAAGARITTNISLGRHVDVHVNATIGHDAVLDDFVSVFPGATVSGNVHLGESATIGTGANVLPGISVGAGAFVGAGSVVTRDVPSDVTVAGVPAVAIESRAHRSTSEETP